MKLSIQVIQDRATIPDSRQFISRRLILQRLASCNQTVFGEVLEHLTNPLDLLTDCVQHVRWIVTSSYPLSHADEYWTRYPDHTDEARHQQPDCLQLLLQSHCECSRARGMLCVLKNRSLREAD